jgi:hypothetical protein
MSEKADWQGVGESFRTLGRQLKVRAVDAGGAVREANEQAEGTMDKVTAAFKTAIDKLDETTTDPQVTQSTRDATARLLDAIKAELTGEGPEQRPEADKRPDGGPESVTDK